MRATGEYEAGMYLVEGRKTAEEFVSLAWSLEDGAAGFYTAVKDTLVNEAAIKVFDSLIKAEETHKTHLLEAYRRLTGKDTRKEGYQEETLSGIMESGISVSDAVQWVQQRERQLQDILEFSMQLETNSLDLYMKISRETDNEEIRKIFNMLIDEEKQHLLRLGNLLDRMYNV